MVLGVLLGRMGWVQLQLLTVGHMGWVHVQGIRIKDAASKQKARELLAAEQALREMEVDAQPSAPKQAVDAMTQ